MRREDRERQLEIVLVEDDKDHAEIIEFYIKKASVHASVKHLGDGETTMRYLQRMETNAALIPDLIILDLKIPKYDGHDILQRIKNNPSLKQIPVIVFTTSNACADREKALNNHANSYIVKPIDEHGFKEIIAPIIRYWELHERMYGRQEDKP